MPSDEPRTRASDAGAPSSEEESSSPADRRAREKAEREVELRKAIGRTVADRYRILELLGTGGMGAVYEAEHLGIGRKVALKFVDSEWLRQGIVASRFAREARAASAIESEHIVSVFDAGTDGERPFLVMELLRGEDLGKRLRREGKIGVEDALEILAQTLRGLADAHEAGIVHRDLKPDNVFLVNRAGGAPLVKIVDFGVSKIERLGSGTAPLALTQKGMVLGTPLYMAPEQAQAFEDVDARADLFSAGAILFECIAGRPPHVGETYEQIIVSICMNDAPDLRTLEPGVPSSLARLVARALTRDRAKRFTSARQMLVALSEVRGAIREGRDTPSGLRADVPVAAVTMLSPGAEVLRADGARPSGARAERASGDRPGAALRGSAPSTDVAWSSGSRPMAELPAQPSRRAPVSGKRLAIVGVVATLAGAAATVALVSFLRGRHGEAGPDLAASTSSASARAVVPAAPATSAPPASATTTAPPSLAALPATSIAAPSGATSAKSAVRDAGASAHATSSSTAASTPHADATPKSNGKPHGGHAGSELQLQREFP